MIPKILHRIWLGQKQIPDEVIEYGNTWQRNHPGWAHILWTEELIDLIPIVNKDLFATARTWIERCDLLRYEILYSVGGVYVDTDVESVKCIDPLLENVEQFATYWVDPGSHWCNQASCPDGKLNNAIMGCSKHNPIFKELLEKLPGSQQQHAGFIQAIAGPDFLDREVLLNPEFTKLKAAYTHPHLWYEEAKPASEYPEAYAIHRWTGFWSGGRMYDASINDNIKFL